MHKLKMFGVAMIAVGVATGAVFAQSGDMNLPLLPPNAKAGECYARAFIPPSYRTTTERVLVKDASESLSVSPAKTDWSDERVLVKEASQKLEVIPATYGWVEEQVLVKPAMKKIDTVPAVYETITERVLDQPAHTVWKKGKGPIQKVDNSTGEIMCLVEIPATYKTVTKKVLKTPATTQEREIPAEYNTVKRQVMKTPPTTRTIEIPAEYKTVRVQKEVAPPSVNRTPIPEEYKTISRHEKVTDGHMEWRSVLCETNAGPTLISSIQRSLKSAGHDPGPIDGIIGTETMAAVRSYQKSKGMATGGLTVETIEALGVRIN